MLRTAVLILAPLAAGCASHAPLATVESVDLERFMGDWYVLAHVPVDVEVEAYNAVETYALTEDGRIATTYSFRDGGFDGELVTLEPIGTVVDAETNAEWGMQFLWPFEAEYLVTWLDAEYRTTIIARTRRDYAWIMAREPSLDAAEMQTLVDALAAQGYDLDELRRVPHRWPDPEHPRDRVEVGPGAVSPRPGA